MTEVSIPHEKSIPQISRRTFLAGLGAAAALELLGGCSLGHPDNILPDHDALTQLPDVPDQPPHTEHLAGIDKGYLKDLLEELQRSSGDKKSRVSAVKASLRIIHNPTFDTYATAFEIDESGIYLTAAHAVPGTLAVPNPNSQVMSHEASIIQNPSDGTASTVTGTILHKQADLAVVYAPTGQSQKPVQNIQLDLSPLKDRQQLWLLAVRNIQGHRYRVTSMGKVDQATHFDETAQVAVKGMIPLGGTSGCPIVNENGAIVGVEAQEYHEGSNNVSNYIGALITPLSYAATLDQYPAYTG